MNRRQKKKQRKKQIKIAEKNMQAAAVKLGSAMRNLIKNTEKACIKFGKVLGGINESDIKLQDTIRQKDS